MDNPTHDPRSTADLLKAITEAQDDLDSQLTESDERRALQLQVGQMQVALDKAARTIAAQEEEISTWIWRCQMATDERRRAEARIAEIEGRLDVAYSLTHGPLPPKPLPAAKIRPPRPGIAPS